MMKKVSIITTLLALIFSPISSAHCGSCNKESKKNEKKCSAKHSNSNSNSITFKVSGMQCQACAKKINVALSPKEGITVKKVCNQSGHVVIALKQPADKSLAIETIKKTGFNVQGEVISLRVAGMTCGGCANIIKKNLEAIEGCKVESISHKSGQCQVILDGNVSKEEVQSSIKTIGFKILPAETNPSGD